MIGMRRIHLQEVHSNEKKTRQQQQPPFGSSRVCASAHGICLKRERDTFLLLSSYSLIVDNNNNNNDEDEDDDVRRENETPTHKKNLTITHVMMCACMHPCKKKKKKGKGEKMGKPLLLSESRVTIRRREGSCQHSTTQNLHGC